MPKDCVYTQGYAQGLLYTPGPRTYDFYSIQMFIHTKSLVVQDKTDFRIQLEGCLMLSLSLLETIHAYLYICMYSLR
jgi:hypothetical protein